MTFIRLLIAEFKAMIYKLPKILFGGGVLILVSALLMVLIAGYSQKTDNSKNIIAISAPDDIFTNAAITAVENMQSVSEICKFKRVSENEAEAMVKDNRASAALILGDNFIEDIINGKNTKPRVLVSGTGNELFTELAECGSSMLSVVQAGIYAAEQEYFEQTGQKISHSLNIDLNMEYIDIVFSRESAFKKISNNITTLQGYYVAMLLPVLMLLLAMAFGIIMFPENKSFYKCLGVNHIMVSLIQFLKAFIIYFVLFMIFVGKVEFNILPLISLALIVTAVYSMSDNKINCSLFIMFFALIMGFLGGAFVTPHIMPPVIREIMTYTPLNVIGLQFMGLNNISYTLVMWFISILIIFIGGRRK